MAKQEDIRKLEENWKSLHQEDRDREEQERSQNLQAKQKEGLKEKTGKPGNQENQNDKKSKIKNQKS